MGRSEYIGSMRFLVCLVLVACGSLSHGEESAAKNILFIAVDDLRPELGVYGARVKTPHFDRLATSGMRFQRAYCQQAVCGASRLSVMGGLYPTLTGEQTFHVDGWRKRHPDLLTLNQHFKEQGYHTVGLGKIYHGTSGPGVDPANWSQWIELGAP
ncbi:MAG: sulfatase-like hydrolase/transferase, partial [Xanthomonadales bacterium]|nr:sulfatase-like hydrolase/transferase [Xanthomonadales bacterium]NIX11801.1 sulfatase-like hydrolase/transferase [Xanthomonadales bacterium]